MDEIDIACNGGYQQPVADPVPFSRSYQLEALEKALKQNTIVYLETGTGKTLISIMLLRSYAHLLRKPSPNVAVFLVPTVVLVTQQAEAVGMHTNLKVGKYYGELGVDYWNAATWKREKDKHEVFVMTPQILLDALRRRFLLFDQIKVLIFDECHNARGKYPYASIMIEFYHRQLASNNLQLPRVFGMTASPIKAKASSTEAAYWKQISELENLLNSKVFTCDSTSELSKYISFSTPKVKMYERSDIPHVIYQRLHNGLNELSQKHGDSLNTTTISSSAANSGRKKLDDVLKIFMFCLRELGVCLAMKAAEVYSHVEEDTALQWGGKMDGSGDRVVRNFSSDAAKVFSNSMPSGQRPSIGHDLITNMTAGYVTSKVVCLVETLLEYREMKDLRCIVFVERIVTAVVISSLLNELLQEWTGWKTEYTAGYTSRLHSQSRKEQNAIVDRFRKGTVNIIVATSMLEEGLDVQSCNVVIRFDLSTTVCSFIQSRGRARMPNSDFILMVESGDSTALARVENYLASGDIMRRESLNHAYLPCKPIDNEMFGEAWYQVESTGAFVTLSSSVQLVYFYCSRLPSDGYFKPYPRFTIDEDLGICTLHLPNSCPIQTITVEGPIKSLKQLACLEACKQLHKVGALTNNLVPDIVKEELEVQEIGFEPFNKHAVYAPPELVSSTCDNESEKLYHCYLIELRRNFQYDVKLQDIVLAVHTRLETDIETLELGLDVDRGKLIVQLKYIGHAKLTSRLVSRCRRLQVAIFRVLLDHNLKNFYKDLGGLSNKNGSAVFDYLLLPSVKTHHQSVSIDWKYITSVQYFGNAGATFDSQTHHFSGRGCGNYVHTKSGLVCRCMLENSLVLTPHNGVLYCIAGSMDGFDGNTYLELDTGESLTYKQFYKRRHGIDLLLEGQTLLKGKRIFTVQNYLQRCRSQRSKEPSNSSYELPPELCEIIMSPISVSTFYSFSFLPSIMHRIESLLIASNLKRMHAHHCTQNVVISTLRVLEAITSKKCQEELYLESLETLGDSFLKYASSQQLFKTFQNQHEGLLTIRRMRIISNATLCKLGCERNIMGFIRNEPFEPKKWMIPGCNTEETYVLREKFLPGTRVYYGVVREIKSKRIADAVEALIGAFLSAGGELAALSFMVWLGIDVDFVRTPYKREFPVKPEIYVDVKYFESLFNYSFKDASLLVEALTHGSYMLPDIPRCYQRLEFLGDAVLDYLITVHLYQKYPGISPELLTDLRAASVNNDCYALSAIKKGLHKHVLHTSQELHRQIANCLRNFEEEDVSLVSTFGYDSETSFPKVLGDVIESVAGAIYVDSGYNKERVFKSIRPLLDPLITPEQLKPHPVKELTELCQKEHYTFKKHVVPKDQGAVARVWVEVEANGIVYKDSSSGANRKVAEKLACKAVLKSLKEQSTQKMHKRMK